MPLTTHVTDRYSTQFVKNLTNPQDPTASAVDAARLLNAANDVEADFKIRVGVAYSDTTDTHISVAVQGVIAKLMLYAGQSLSGANDAHQQYMDRLWQLAKVTGRNRILPKTTSELRTKSEKIGSINPSPDFERRKFVHYVMDDPSSVSEFERLSD